MGRAIAAVVVSYVVMAIFIMGMFMGIWFGIGPDRLLVPGEWRGGLFLTIAAPSITIFSGVFGGWLCAKIGRGGGPVKALAGVVLVLGLIVCYFTLQKPFPTGPREPGMTVEQFMEKGREPTWLAVANPIIGCAAVLVGGLVLGGGKKGKRVG